MTSHPTNDEVNGYALNVVAKKCGAPPRSDGSSNRPDCVAAVRAQTRDRNQHYADSAARRARVLTITAWLAVMVSASFVLVQIVTGSWSWQISSHQRRRRDDLRDRPMAAAIRGIGCAAYLYRRCLRHGLRHLLGHGHRFGIAQFFFLVGACLVVLLLGIEHIVLASALAAIAAGLIIAVRVPGPAQHRAATGLGPVDGLCHHHHLQRRDGGRDGVVRPA